MNFIDKALANKDTMSADDFLQAMSEIYGEPQCWDLLDNYPQFVRDIIYIIDYDTDLQMEGLDGFFDNLSEARYERTYSALVNCGALKEADILKKAKLINYESDECYDEYEKLESETALHNDYDEFWELVRNYIDKVK